MHGYTDGWGIFWGDGWLTILLWIGVIGLVLWGIRSLLTIDRTPEPPHIALSPLDMAQKRYARGEISRDEYLAIVADLQSTDDAHYSKGKRSEF